MSTASADALTPDAVAAHLTGRLGTPYLYEPECESTQLLLLRSGLPDGAVAVTEHQTGGRGRLGRTWEAPPGTALLASVLLDAPADRQAAELSLVAALAVAETVERATNLAAQVKWPNDVMVNRRKVAGILCELSDGVVVVGIGINVNQARDELPAGTPTPAASLRTLTGTTYDRTALLGSLLALLERMVDAWRSGGLDAVYDDLGSRNFLHGRRVRVDGTSGTGARILRDGRLEIETDAGETLVIESGEVAFER
jgi:BirA family biotin operon repressor/biotin-[acetyl-CoA-carboxylase] ligase